MAAPSLVPKEKKPRRGKLTTAQRLEPVNRVIASLEARLKAARDRRVRIIESEEQKLNEAQRQMQEARALDTKDAPY